MFMKEMLKKTEDQMKAEESSPKEGEEGDNRRSRTESLDSHDGGATSTTTAASVNVGVSLPKKGPEKKGSEKKGSEKSRISP